jgi:hypothetical protein
MKPQFSTPIKLLDINVTRAKFDSKLIRLCLDKLLSFIKEFQIQELPEEGENK